MKYVLAICMFFATTTAHSQVLITLLLGDKINSPNLEFGLEGGLNWTQITGISFAVKYYEGFANVYKGVPGRRNRSLFFAVTLPIGASEKKKQEEEKKKKQAKD